MRFSNRFCSSLDHFRLLNNEPRQILGLKPGGGFRLKNGKEYFEGLAYINSQPYLWKATNPVTREAFMSLAVIRPLPDFVIFGTGKQPVPLSPGIREFLRELGINHDVYHSVNVVVLIFRKLQ